LEARLFVATLFVIAHFVASPFWSGSFWREFHENNFLLSFFNFLIHKKIFSVFFSFYFSKTVEDFLFIFNKFLSTLHYTSSNTSLLFFYSVIPVTDQINS